MIVHWAVRELVKSRRHALGGVFFILIIGFLGPLLSSSLQTSVSRYLSLRSRQLMSADFAVANTAEFKNDEAALVRHVTSAVKTSEAVEFVTMAKGRGVSTLVEIQAVDETFPIYGTFVFKSGDVASSAAALSREAITWVYPEVLAQLGLQVGDTVDVGSLSLKIAGVLKDAPGFSRAGVFAPRLYIGRSQLTKTGLTDFGAQVLYRLYVQLPPGASPDLAAATVKSMMTNPDISVRTPDDSTQSLERFFRFFNLYLSSVSMILFALSWISAFYILQIYLSERLRNSAVLLTFGSSRWRALAISALQIFFVMLASLLVASAVVTFAIAIGAHALIDILPPGFELRFALVDFAKLFVISCVSSGAFLVPSAIRLRAAPLTDLLAEVPGGRVTLRAAVVAYSPLAIVFVALAVWLMSSLRNGLLMTAGLLVTVVIGWVLARAFFRSLYSVARGRAGFARLVATQLVRSRFGTNLCFITILIGSLVLNLVPHLMSSALKEIEPLQGRNVPALFLFNIPESGLADLENFAAREQVDLKYVAPMVLARVTKVNGEPTQNDSFQRFPVRLTYRDHLIGAEKLVGGTLATGAYGGSGAAEISIEKDYAERVGLKQGDLVEFDVQGIPIQAKITSTRKVRWTDFNPNFFFVLQPGVIDDAPKTYLASVYAREATDKSKLQYALVRDFPDVSVLDVGRTLDKILEIARSILGPVQIAAAVAVFMSFLILIAVIAHNLGLRGRELDIQKLLGADRSLIRRMIVAEYGLLALGASVLGSLFAVGLTWLVTSQIFEISMRIDVRALAAALAVTVLVSLVLAAVVATRVLALRGATTKL